MMISMKMTTANTRTRTASMLIGTRKVGKSSPTKTMGIIFLLLVCASCFMQLNEVQGFSASRSTLTSKAVMHLSCPPLATCSQHRRNLSTIRYRLLSGRESQFPSASKDATGTTTRLYSSMPSSVDVRSIVDWVQGKPVEFIVSKDETIAICRELTGDQALLDSLERAVVENWDRILEKLIENDGERKNTLAGLLGEEATQRLLRGVQNVDLYSDSKTVNAFLQSEAVNDLFAQTLYDGIYEFFQTIDVFGNIISNLPVLGPIRNKIRDDLKKQLDRTLGPTLRNFLKGYTSVAIGQAAGFVLAEQNTKAFGSANARLLGSILDRPLKDLLPESSNPSIAKLRTEFFGYLRNLGDDDSSDLEDYAALVYDLVGDKSLDSLGLNVNRVLDASPTLESTVNRILNEAMEHRSS